MSCLLDPGGGSSLSGLAVSRLRGLDARGADGWALRAVPVSDIVARHPRSNFEPTLSNPASVVHKPKNYGISSADQVTLTPADAGNFVLAGRAVATFWGGMPLGTAPGGIGYECGSV
jgi:hypothetical protein